jgi:hypothetical protein
LRELIHELLGKPVDEIVLFLIGRDVREREHGNRVRRVGRLRDRLWVRLGTGACRRRFAGSCTVGRPQHYREEQRADQDQSRQDAELSGADVP